VFVGNKAALQVYTVSAPVSDPDPDDDPVSYRGGWNSVVNDAITAVPGHDSGSGNAYYEDGQTDARAALIAEMTLMLLADPT
jgi:hypothetical protein